MAEKENSNSSPEDQQDVPDVASIDVNTEDGDSLEQQLEMARADAAGNLDNFLRAKAESENIRRRSAEDVIKARKFAVEQFAGELLAVRDSLELASQVSFEGENSPAVTRMLEGVALTLRQMDSAFEKASITVINPVGEKFNPEQHQAMSMIEAADVEPSHIVTVLQKGYLINERLLRPAMVVIAKAVTSDTTEGENSDGTKA